MRKRDIEIFEEIMAYFFPNLMKLWTHRFKTFSRSQAQETWRKLHKIASLSKFSIEQRWRENLETITGKKGRHYIQKLGRQQTAGQKQCQQVDSGATFLTYWWGKTCQLSIILYPGKISFKHEGKIHFQTYKSWNNLSPKHLHCKRC